MEKIINEFKINGIFLSVEPYGSGHINDTYKVITTEAVYILQQINHDIFKNIDGLMKNIDLVTTHIRDNILNQGMDPDKHVLQIIRTIENDLFLKINGGYWRMYLFVKDAETYDLVENSEHFYQSGLAFGLFQKQLDDFDETKLIETIPNFHNTPLRYKKLIEVINKNPERLLQAEKEINFIQEREAFTHIIVDSYNRGLIKKRVTHNDTKLNNVMINPVTNKATCVIDLDTVMAGFVTDDFGDSIRFGCNTALEDEKDLNKVKFDIELYELYLRGYMAATGSVLTKEEIKLLPFGAKMMTLENAIRFITDYLEGDIYFKTDYVNHNLVRARTQIKLVREMEKVWNELITFSNQYL